MYRHACARGGTCGDATSASVSEVVGNGGGVAADGSMDGSWAQGSHAQ